MGVTGCHDDTPPPPRVPVPTADDVDRRAAMTRYQANEKPLPAPRDDGSIAAPPFYDAPIVNQQLAPQPVFVDAYRRVGSPRMIIVVSRTFESGMPAGGDSLDSKNLDPKIVNSIDYEAMENIMTDWFACNGEVTILSSSLMRSRSNEPTAAVLGDIGADVLIRVRAQPTGQTAAGPSVRLIAEAMNVKGGQSIGRAVVDVPPPLEKTTINRYTRFVASKLMDGMIGSWLAPSPAPTTRPQ